MPQEIPDIFRKTVDEYARLLRQPLPASQTDAPVSTELPVRDPARPCALLFSPHPDDECLTGGLPLRLQAEQNWQVINIAVTLGSNTARQPERKAELGRATAILGFQSVLPATDGFSNINNDARVSDPFLWRKIVTRAAELIAHFQPQVLIMPHASDWHATHVGTHLLAMDALATMPQNFSYYVVQTEYWQAMTDANLMIGLKSENVATLMAALASHIGEVARNPYDKRFPSYLIDNVRRGSERLEGPGTAAKTMDFAMLYKFGLWRQGKFIPSALNRIVDPDENVASLFE